MAKKQGKKKHSLISFLIAVVIILLLAVLAKTAFVKLQALFGSDSEADPNSSSGALPSAWIHVPNGEGGTYLIKKSKVLNENPLTE